MKKASYSIQNILILVSISLLIVVFFMFLIINNSKDNDTDIKSEKTDLEGTSFENLNIPDGYDIRQFEGITLRFIVENNRHATILLNASEEFSEITGINIKIKPVDFDTLIHKINLDFISQSGQYQIVYVDPYQTLNRFYDYLEILNKYNQDPSTPRITGFMNDFFGYQTDAISYFEEYGKVYTIPFDSTTMIMYYRKDIFDKYADQFYAERGYDWTPGTKDFTWERYIEVSKWIDENVPDREVKYGSGSMAQEHNSIFCEFANILAAYGGDFFDDEYISTLGLHNYKHINTLDDTFIKALDVYKEIVKVSAPNSVEWNWTDSATAFRNGEIAMMLNWDENYPYLNDKIYSKVAGNVGCAILPYGDKRSANIFGGSGIGINRYATEEEKQAAWLYLTWVTSKDMQFGILTHPKGGNLPTRKSIYEERGINQAVHGHDEKLNSKLINTVLDAWDPENIYLRPKISNFYDVEKVIIRNLHNYIEKDLKSKTVAKTMFSELESIMVESQEAEGEP